MVDEDRVRSKDRYRKYSSGDQSRPTSDGYMYRYGKKSDFEVSIVKTFSLVKNSCINVSYLR